MAHERVGLEDERSWNKMGIWGSQRQPEDAISTRRQMRGGTRRWGKCLKVKDGNKVEHKYYYLV